MICCCKHDALHASCWHVRLQQIAAGLLFVHAIWHMSSGMYCEFRGHGKFAVFVRRRHAVLWGHMWLDVDMLEQVVRTLLARLKEQANTRFAVSALEEPAYGAVPRAYA